MCGLRCYGVGADLWQHGCPLMCIIVCIGVQVPVVCNVLCEVRIDVANRKFAMESLVNHANRLDFMQQARTCCRYVQHVCVRAVLLCTYNP